MFSFKNWTAIELESRFLSVNLVSSYRLTRVGRRVMLKWSTQLKLGWWNNVRRLCNPQPYTRECSLAPHQRVETHHDSDCHVFEWEDTFIARGNTMQAVKTLYWWSSWHINAASLLIITNHVVLQSAGGELTDSYLQYLVIEVQHMVIR